jgi:hypothetical protein
VRDRVAAGKCIPEPWKIRQTGLDGVNAWQLNDRKITPIDTSGYHDHLVAAANELSRQVSANETGPARDGDLHRAPLTRTRRRRLIWAGQTALMKSVTVRASWLASRR